MPLNPRPLSLVTRRVPYCFGQHIDTTLAPISTTPARKCGYRLGRVRLQCGQFNSFLTSDQIEYYTEGVSLIYWCTPKPTSNARITDLVNFHVIFFIHVNTDEEYQSLHSSMQMCESSTARSGQHCHVYF